MRHLITGGSGFVGDLAARELFKRGEQVRVLDIWEDPSRPPGIEFVHCSVLNRDGVAAAMRGVDVVHHNAALVAQYLASHPKVVSVNYLGFLGPMDARRAVYERQCGSAGSTFSFCIRGGQEEAFRMLNALQVMKLAVSHGGTETLISHPASTTHSGVPLASRERLGVTDSLFRLSVGIENADDLIADLEQALEQV